MRRRIPCDGHPAPPCGAGGWTPSLRLRGGGEGPRLAVEGAAKGVGPQPTPWQCGGGRSGRPGGRGGSDERVTQELERRGRVADREDLQSDGEEGRALRIGLRGEGVGATWDLWWNHRVGTWWEDWE